MDSDTSTKVSHKLLGRWELQPLLEHFAQPGGRASDNLLGRWISVGIVMAAVALGLVVLYHIDVRLPGVSGLGFQRRL